MKSITRILNAFKYSFDGLASVFKSEPAFRQELLLFVVGTVAAVLLPIGWIATALLIAALGLILMAELVNTAIETVVDRISTDRHALSKKAKDIGSALVLLAFINAGIIWAMALIP